MLKKILVIILLSSIPQLSFSFSTVNNNNKLFNDYFDFIKSFGLIKTNVEGIRPKSTIELARITGNALQMAREEADAKESLYYLPILYKLTENYKEDIARIYAEVSPWYFNPKIPYNVKFDYLYLHAGIRDSNTTQDSAKIYPVPNFWEGRYFGGKHPYKETDYFPGGHYLDLESTSKIDFLKYFNLLFENRLDFEFPEDSDDAFDFNFDITKAYLKFSIFNQELIIGRDKLVWGYGRRGGLLFSDNAMAMGELNYIPMFKVTNTFPIILPWVFKHIGKMRYVFFFTYLNKSRTDFSRPALTGVRFCFLPTPIFEWGFSHVILGKNSFQFHDLFKYYLFISPTDDTNLLSGSDTADINRLFGFDFKLTIPYLRYTEVFSEVLFDDFRELTRSFKNTFNYYGGIHVPRIIPSGRIGLDFEYSHTSKLAYGSQTFHNGYTYKERYLGSNLGPSADGILLSLLYWDLENSRTNLAFDFTRRGALTYLGADPTKTQPEKNYGIHWKYSYVLSMETTLSFTFSYAYIDNFDNLDGHKNIFFGGILLNFLNPGKKYGL